MFLINVTNSHSTKVEIPQSIMIFQLNLCCKNEYKQFLVPQTNILSDMLFLIVTVSMY